MEVSFVSDSCDIGCRPVGHGLLRERGNEWGGGTRRVQRREEARETGPLAFRGWR